MSVPLLTGAKRDLHSSCWVWCINWHTCCRPIGCDKKKRKKDAGQHKVCQQNAKFSFDKVSQVLWCHQTSHFISHFSTLLFMRAAWHSQGCRQRIRWRRGSLTEHLWITTLAEKLLLQCDSEPVKAAAPVRQPALSAAKQSVKLTGTHLHITCFIYTYNLTCRLPEVYLQDSSGHETNTWVTMIVRPVESRLHLHFINYPRSSLGYSCFLGQQSKKRKSLLSCWSLWTKHRSNESLCCIGSVAHTVYTLFFFGCHKFLFGVVGVVGGGLA